MYPRESSEPSHHIFRALIDVMIDVDDVLLAMPSLLQLVPIIQFHTSDSITDGRRGLRPFTRAHKPLVRIACRSGVTGGVGRIFGGTFVRAQGGKTDLTADGTDDGLRRHALEARTESGEASADDAERGFDGGPEHDPVIVI